MDGRFTVDLPEQVGLEFQLAGIGARFTAAIIDAAVQLSLIGLGLVLAILGIAPRPGAPALGGLADEWIALPALAHGALLLWGFTIFWGYHVIFDLSWEGQSPGKRALGLRTLRVDGLPVGPTESALRNLLRPIDLLPIFYGVGGITAILTPLRQRMGDLAAGTVVVRDALSPDALRAAPAPTELSAIAEAWVARRDQLSPDHRATLARAIAQRSGSEDRDAERAVMALARGVPLP